MDNSPIRQTSELEKFISTAGKSIIISWNVENTVMWSLRILYAFVLRAEKRYHIFEKL